MINSNEIYFPVYTRDKAFKIMGFEFISDISSAYVTANAVAYTPIAVSVIQRNISLFLKIYIKMLYSLLAIFMESYIY